MESNKKRKARNFSGEVISDKMDKTRVVLITTKLQDPMYRKTYLKTSKIKAHDEKNEYKKGDLVEIISVKPISRDKSWQIVKKVSADKKEV